MTEESADPWIDIWNLHDDIEVRADLQEIFNVVGRVNRPEQIESLTYSLNGKKEVSIHFKTSDLDSGRLECLGDFNIDTITKGDLLRSNQIVFTAKTLQTRSMKKKLRFHVNFDGDFKRYFHLDLGRVRFAEEAGQIVDGRWRVDQNDDGERFLEIKRTDSGLDRIILLGPGVVHSGFRVSARLCVSEWTAAMHNVGLLFKWNPHRQGDGRLLPTEWTTGLAYYYSHCQGIRIRVGIDVHLAEDGRKVGDHILCEAPLSKWRFNVNRFLAKMRLRAWRMPQLVPDRHYCFELVVTSRRTALTVWQADHRKPRPQLECCGTDDLIRFGSIGIIAHKCGVRVYEFDCSPATINDTGL